MSRSQESPKPSKAIGNPFGTIPPIHELSHEGAKTIIAEVFAEYPISTPYGQMELEAQREHIEKTVKRKYELFAPGNTSSSGELSLAALGHPFYITRANALHSLGLRSEQDFQTVIDTALCSLNNEADEWTRYIAIRVLGDLGPRAIAAETDLARVATEGDAGQDLQRCALTSLAKIGSERVTELTDRIFNLDRSPFDLQPSHAEQVAHTLEIGVSAFNGEEAKITFLDAKVILLRVTNAASVELCKRFILHSDPVLQLAADDFLSIRHASALAVAKLLLKETTNATAQYLGLRTLLRRGMFSDDPEINEAVQRCANSKSLPVVELSKFVSLLQRNEDAKPHLFLARNSPLAAHCAALMDENKPAPYLSAAAVFDASIVGLIEPDKAFSYLQTNDAPGTMFWPLVLSNRTTPGSAALSNEKSSIPLKTIRYLEEECRSETGIHTLYQAFRFALDKTHLANFVELISEQSRNRSEFTNHISAALLDTSPTVRRAAANFFVNYPDRNIDFIKTLVYSMSDGDLEVRRAARNALIAVGKVAIPSLDVILNDHSRTKILSYGLPGIFGNFEGNIFHHSLPPEKSVRIPHYFYFVRKGIRAVFEAIQKRDI